MCNHGTIIRTSIIVAWCNRSVLNEPWLAHKWLVWLTITMISWLFDTPKSSVSRYLITWANLLHFSHWSIVIWQKIKNYKKCLKLSKLNILPLDAFYTVPKYFVKSPRYCSPKAVFTQVISTMSHTKECLQ